MSGESKFFWNRNRETNLSKKSMNAPFKSAKEPRSGKIRDLLQHGIHLIEATNLAEYMLMVHETSEIWQREDWKNKEKDEEYLLNNTRLVGQTWFRGHQTDALSLQPGLYREGTRSTLAKQVGSPLPHDDDRLLKELFDLEHELRIDFVSYGHLLNDVNQAQTTMDWYFLMQHHGIPTRLLDWTTNALAALFFALEAESKHPEAKPSGDKESAVAVWMIDAYWLAMRLSDDWYGPILPWSSDAEKYVPPLERLTAEMTDSLALVPRNAMPIEPAALHPRVAAQEGRFIIFGRILDLLDHRVRLELQDEENCVPEILRVRQIRFRTSNVDSVLRDLAQLGVSRRTLFPDLDGLSNFLRWKHFHRLSGYDLA